MFQVERPAPEMHCATEDLPVCPGITDPKLQMYAELPPPPNDENCCKYYLHAVYTQCGERMTCRTTIRAHACEGSARTSDGEMCGPCGESKVLVLKKHVRKTVSDQKEVKKNTPLSKLSKAKVANALKVERLEKKTPSQAVE